MSGAFAGRVKKNVTGKRVGVGTDSLTTACFALGTGNELFMPRPTDVQRSDQRVHIHATKCPRLLGMTGLNALVRAWAASDRGTNRKIVRNNSDTVFSPGYVRGLASTRN